METQRIVPSGGLNKLAQAALIKDTESPDMENVQFDELGAVETVKGSYTLAGNTTIRGIGRYKTATVDETIFASAGGIYKAVTPPNILSYEQSTIEGSMLEFEGTMAYEQSEEKASNGRYSLKCTVSAVNQYVWTTARACSPSTQYTAQLKIRGVSNDTLRIRVFDGVDANDTIDTSSTLSFDDSGWTTATLTFTTASDNTSFRLAIICIAHSANSDVFYIDDLMVTAGASAGTWRPGELFITGTLIYSGLTNAASARFLQVGNILIIADGVDRPLKYDGTNVSLLGIDAPTYQTVTGAVTTSGGALADGAYKYKVTLVNDLDFESNPTDETATITVSSGGSDDIITLSNLPVGDEYGVTVQSSPAANTDIYGANYGSQTFIPKYSRASVSVLLYLTKTGTPNNCVLEIRSVDGDNKPTSTILGTVTKAAADITGAGWYTFALAVSLTKDTSYALVVHQASDGGGAGDYYDWDYKDSSVYSDGSYGASTDSGATWTLNAARDFLFRVKFNAPHRISKRKIYRSIDASAFVYLDTISNNTALTYVDNGGVTAGTATPPDDHDPPPSKLKYLVEHKSRVIAVDADELSRIYYSTVDDTGQQPEAWPTANWDDVPGFDNIKGLSVYTDRLMVLKEYNIHGFEGANPESANAWTHFVYNDTSGCIGDKAFTGADNVLFYLSHDLTVRAMSNTNLESFLSVTRMSDKVKPIIAQFKDLSATVMAYWDNKLFMTNQIKSTTYSLIFDFISQVWTLRNHKEFASTTTIYWWYVRDDELYHAAGAIYRYGIQEYDYLSSGLAAYWTTKELDQGFTDREKLYYTLVVETDTYPVARNLAVYYALDGASTWTALTTSMSMLDTTRGRLSTRLNIRKPGRSIRFKVASPGTTAVEPWKVYSLTLEFKPGRKV